MRSLGASEGIYMKTIPYFAIQNGDTGTRQPPGSLTAARRPAAKKSAKKSSAKKSSRKKH
jgi:hypothetical protein